MIEIIEKYNPVVAENESLQSKFIKLGKEYFGLNIKGEFDYINSVKDSIKIMSYDVQADLKEIFIPYSNAPVYWIYDSWLLNQVEDYMKLNFLRAKYFELHKSIKENYTKWVVTKLKNEKEYYANITINFIERDVFKHNFFKFILHGIILSTQPSFYNFAKALNSFNTAKELINVSRMSDNVKQELNYILTLYIGFAHLKEKEYELANITFKDALEIKSYGITAKFYTALTEINLNNEEQAVEICREILNYDFNRLTVATANNNFGMFNFFVKNGIFNNIFYKKDFWKISNQIELMIQPYHSAAENELSLIQKKITNLKEKNINEYLSDEISKSISFMERVVQAYTDTNTVYIIGLYPEFASKFRGIIDTVVANMRQSIATEIKTKLTSFDNAIKENEEAEKRITTEIENFKLKVKDALVKGIQSIASTYDEQIKLLESRIAFIPFVEKYNPNRTFTVNMSYNFVIAFVVMIIGSMAYYTNRTVADINELNSFFSLVLASGLKWGLISFSVGTLISLVISGLVMIERSDEKQKLLRKTKSYNAHKNKAIAEAKEYSEHREKVMLDNLNSNLTQHKKRLAECTEQRENELQRLNNEAAERIQKFEEHLSSLLD